jgi:HSP20 family protein
MTLALLVCAAVLGTAWAQGDPDEVQADQDMERLHKRLVRVKRQVDNLMKDIVATADDQTGALVSDLGQAVKVDITEDANAMTVKADLPGMDKDRIDITFMNERLLKISGTRDVLKKETTPNMVRQERMSGHFERLLTLPADGLSEGLKAVYQNGVLEITIPKKNPGEPKQVKIKVL